MKAAIYMHKIFTPFKPTSYLQYHSDQQQSSQNFRKLFLSFTLAQLYQGSLTMGGGGGQVGKGIL